MEIPEDSSQLHSNPDTIAIINAINASLDLCVPATPPIGTLTRRQLFASSCPVDLMFTPVPAGSCESEQSPKPENDAIYPLYSLQKDLPTQVDSQLEIQTKLSHEVFSKLGNVQHVATSSDGPIEDGVSVLPIRLDEKPATKNSPLAVAMPMKGLQTDIATVSTELHPKIVKDSSKPMDFTIHIFSSQNSRRSSLCSSYKNERMEQRNFTSDVDDAEGGFDFIQPMYGKRKRRLTVSSSAEDSDSHFNEKEEHALKPKSVERLKQTPSSPNSDVDIDVVVDTDSADDDESDDFDFPYENSKVRHQKPGDISGNSESDGTQFSHVSDYYKKYDDDNDNENEIEDEDENAGNNYDNKAEVVSDCSGDALEELYKDFGTPIGKSISPVDSDYPAENDSNLVPSELKTRSGIRYFRPSLPPNVDDEHGELCPGVRWRKRFIQNCEVDGSDRFTEKTAGRGVDIMAIASENGANGRSSGGIGNFGNQMECSEEDDEFAELLEKTFEIGRYHKERPKIKCAVENNCELEGPKYKPFVADNTPDDAELEKRRGIRLIPVTPRLRDAFGNLLQSVRLIIVPVKKPRVLVLERLTSSKVPKRQETA